MNPWIFPAVISAASASGLLAVIYSYLYAQRREQALGIWAAAWSIYTVRFAFVLAHLRWPGLLVLDVIDQGLSLVAALLFLEGTRRYFKLGSSTLGWALLITSGYALHLMAMLGGWGFVASHLPLSVIYATVFVYVGYVFLRHRSGLGPAGALTGWSFVLWGLHKADYPFLRTVEWFAPWGFLLAALLALLVAVGVLLVYYESAERRLRESEARYRELFTGNRAVELIIDPGDGAIVEANQAALAYYGYDQATITQMKIAQINTLSSEQVTREMERARSERRDHFYFRHRLADGTVRDVEVHSGPIEVNGKTLLYSIVHDITERRRAEHNYQRLFENTVVGIYQSTREGRVIRANPALARILGYDSEDDLVHGVANLGQEVYVHPEVREQILAEIQRDGAITDREILVRRKDGGELWCSLNLRVVPESEYEAFHFEGSLVDIDRRKRAEEEMVRARDAAQAASQAKSEFLAMMSHELRTPMNAIIGMGELVAEGELPEELRGYLEVQSRASHGLLELLDDILELSRVEAGRVAVCAQPFAVAEMFDSVLAILSGRAAEKGLELSAEIAPGTPARLLGDVRRLRQVLLNLVGNALKFTARGSVRLEVGPGGVGQVVFSVRDTGIGISAEMQERIFEPFVQVDSSDSRGYGGSGLGLAICSRLVELMGGDIGIESRPGEGSRFRVTLPMVEASDAPLPEGPEIDAAVDDAVNDTVGRPLRLLLAEDSEDNALLIRAYLKGSPHTLVVVGNGREAVERFKAEPFDAVLMDVQMPVLDGYGAVAEMRAWERETGRVPTPILALTAHAMREDAVRTREAGCDRHLTKPIRKKVLLQTLREISERDQWRD